MKFLPKIKNFFSKLYGIFKRKIIKKVTSATYVGRVPSRRMELFNLIEKGLQEELADKTAVNQYLKKKLKKKEEKEEARKEVEHIKKLAKEYREKRRKRERKKEGFLKWIGPNPRAFLKSDSNFPKGDLLWGFKAKEVEGYTLFAPVLIDEESGEKYVPPDYGDSIKSLFKNNTGIISQLNLGKYDSNYLYDGLEVFLSEARRIEAQELLRKMKSGKRMMNGGTKRKEPMTPEDLEEEKEISKREKKIKELRAKLMKKDEKIKELQKEKDEALMLAHQYDKESQEYKASMENLSNRLSENIKLMTNALSSLQDMKINSVLGENAMHKYKNTAKKLTEDISEFMARPSKKIRRRIQEEMRKMAAMRRGKEGGE